MYSMVSVYGEYVCTLTSVCILWSVRTQCSVRVCSSVRRCVKVGTCVPKRSVRVTQLLVRVYSVWGGLQWRRKLGNGAPDNALHNIIGDTRRALPCALSICFPTATEMKAYLKPVEQLTNRTLFPGDNFTTAPTKKPTNTNLSLPVRAIGERRQDDRRERKFILKGRWLKRYFSKTPMTLEALFRIISAPS